MRQYPPYANASNMLAVVQDILGLRREDITEVEQLQQGKLKGRDRTGVRAVPTSATDTVDTDIVGDVVKDATYRYELIDISGTLKWDRRALSVGW